jgi:hypothetical protein
MVVGALNLFLFVCGMRLCDSIIRVGRTSWKEYR